MTTARSGKIRHSTCHCITGNPNVCFKHSLPEFVVVANPLRSKLDRCNAMDIKVEPLNPGIFSGHSSGSTDRMRVPTKTENDSALYDQVSDYVPPQQSDTSYKYQSTSMPVFPNMPYPSAYPYVPIRPAPSQTVQVSPQYPQMTSGVSDPYDVEEEAAFEEKVPRNSTGIIGKRSHLPKRYKCAMCAYRTRYKSDLNRHVRKHAIATFNCDICNMPFKTVGNVEFHKRKEHSGLLANQTTASVNDVLSTAVKCVPMVLNTAPI
ncbi:hypothetical protein FSP39_021351 [Pinctada imbricata]|uniref:C2H2-type domain-containing protein n=1 Tax=Pinctada imbricata TaxID=66713 RepID=A0AA88Y1G6_PINIB|nr:hypothetical protein FSP39_021351 [Pinctada imbricata]